jgi:hypothetical protein
MCWKASNFIYSQSRPRDHPRPAAGLSVLLATRTAYPSANMTDLMRQPLVSNGAAPPVAQPDLLAQSLPTRGFYGSHVVDDVLHTSGKRLARKWFRQKLHPSVEMAMVQNCVFRVACGEQDLESGAGRSNGVGKLAAVQASQTDKPLSRHWDMIW